MATKWQRFSAEIPKRFKPAARKAIAQDVIDEIYKRSKGGENINRGHFPFYTREYAKMKGVSMESVNLILNDKMLKAMKLISHKAGNLLIGYKNGSTENAKADGNHRGTYGKQSPTSKARPFVGISKKDLNTIIKKYDKKPAKEIQRISREVVEGIR